MRAQYDFIAIGIVLVPVADPGFPSEEGGAPSHWWGAPTSDVGTFWQKCMQKRKNWILLEGVHAGSAPP